MALNTRLDKNESALWNEVGSRGDYFRSAIRDRASEQVRVNKKMSEVIDSNGVMLDSVKKSDELPEAVANAPLAPQAEVVHLRDEGPPEKQDIADPGVSYESIELDR